MGCQQSMAQNAHPSFESASSRTNGVKDKLNHSSSASRHSMIMEKRDTKFSMTASNATSTEEKTADAMPKVDHNGNLVAEEIVRRTSSSSHISSVTIGRNDRGRKVLGVKVRDRE
jgi:hypothetical protein